MENSSKKGLRRSAWRAGGGDARPPSAAGHAGVVFTPGHIREIILSDHQALRERLAEIDSVAELVEAGGIHLDSVLRGLGLAFSKRFLRHLRLEESYLLPLLARAGAHGARAADHIRIEHRQQTADLLRLMDDLRDRRRRSREIGTEMRELVDRLRADIEDEERGLLSSPIFRGH